MTILELRLGPEDYNRRRCLTVAVFGVWIAVGCRYDRWLEVSLCSEWRGGWQKSWDWFPRVLR